MKRTVLLAFLTILLDLSLLNAQELDPLIEQRIDEIMAEINAQDYETMIDIKCDQCRPKNSWESESWTVNGIEIPGFYYADSPNGVGDGVTPAVNGYDAGKATAFPTRMNMSNTWNMDLIEQVSVAMSEEFVASGVNVALNGCIDLIRDPRVGRAQEALGEDPYLAGKIAIATVQGTQSTGLICDIKHYNLNYIEKGRGMMLDYWFGPVNNYNIDERTLLEHYSLPYKMAIDDAHPMSIMAAYNEINDEKCTENYNLLTEVLKDQLGYKYTVVSDWTANVSGSKAFNAGLDCDESNPFPSIYQQSLEDDVKNGSISMEKLDESVRRVLRAKLDSRIMDFYNQYPDNISTDVINSPEHQELALGAARESIVLLENKGSILPLDMEDYDRIAVIGPAGDKDNVLLGDVENSSYVDAAYEVSLLDGIVNKLGNSAEVTFHEGCLIQENTLLDPFYMSDALQAASEADIVLFTGGIHYEIEGEAQDRENWTIALPGKQVELMNKIKEETGKPIVVVLVGSCALQVSDFIDSADAIVMAGYPGMEGGNAVADVLFGDYNPSGKLTVTTPVEDDQMPDLGIPGESEFYFGNDISTGVGYRYYDKAGITPQFSFGYGQSYTTFDISDMEINGMTDSLLIASESSLPVTVSVHVTNTGTLEGAEVVQLYISYDGNSMVPMPVKQLKGFAKVNLSPGETKTVEMELGREEFSHYDVSSNQFVIENGLFHVLVGNSSDNLLLEGSVYLSE